MKDFCKVCSKYSVDDESCDETCLHNHILRSKFSHDKKAKELKNKIKHLEKEISNNKEVTYSLKRELETIKNRDSHYISSLEKQILNLETIIDLKEIEQDEFDDIETWQIINNRRCSEIRDQVILEMETDIKDPGFHINKLNSIIFQLKKELSELKNKS